MKTALLVVSFGTSHLDTFQQTIVKTEQAISQAFPSCPFYRAFTSNIVRVRLKEKQNLCVDSVPEALARMEADGVTHVILQPTLLIPGEEYDLLREAVERFAGNLQVEIGKPLLCEDRDLENMVTVLQEAYPVDRETVLLTMGHGTEHRANDLYHRLREKMCRQTCGIMRLCTVEGSPSFEEAVRELAALPHRNALVVPLLLVAGDHAKNDMAGEEPDSLRSMLEAQGYRVTCKLQGLGALPAVQEQFVRNARDAALRLQGKAAT